MLPQAPAWFTRHLRVINPTLGARFNPRSQRWEVTQSIKKWMDRGNWNGSRLVELVAVPERIIEIPECGSRVFQDLASLWGPKYNNRFEEFAKIHKIRTH